MTQESKFIIVTPVWNAEKYIGRCIESLLSQEYKNWEMRIMDDCSTDGTRSIARAYALSDARIKLYPKRDKMFQLGNFAWACQDTNPDDVIVSVDGDDALFHDKVLTLLNKYYTEDPNLWITTGCLMDYSHTGGKLSEDYPYLNRPARFECNTIKDFTASHLRTFRAHLFDRIDQSDFYNEEGEIWETAGDLIIMQPMIQMAGPKRYKWLEHYLYLYNDVNSMSDHVKDETAELRQEIAATKMLDKLHKYKEIE